jgi:D-alanyl-D-alanine dipeptidase
MPTRTKINSYLFILISLPVWALTGCSPTPPHESGDFKKTDLVELIKLDTTLHLDIRYATSNNLAGRPVYTEARAFLQRQAAEALVRVNGKLRPQGYGLLIFDGYRPWSVTKLFWDITPDSNRKFVADPKKGSRHNRGCAVDLSLFDLATGKEVEMTGVYDEMSERSYPYYKGGTVQQHKMRDLLRTSMESEGFAVFEFEWWHFDYKDWQSYGISNIPFSAIQ